MLVKIIGDTIHSVKVIVFRKTTFGIEFVVIKEPEGWYSFPGGAQDVIDNSLKETAQRELKEELGLTSASYTLESTDITHAFLHTDKNSPRYGKKGVLHIFLAEYNGKDQIHLDSQLQEFAWDTESAVLAKLEHAYPYLKTVFSQAMSLLDK
jgi:8-oxo-dGTP pyrophosphatase MutT (NUDIX family)